jgi:hypothetical protein
MLPSGIKVHNKWHGAIIRIHAGMKFVVLPLQALLIVATWYYLCVAGARGVRCHEPIITDRNTIAQRASTVEWRRNCIWMRRDRGWISLPGLWAHYTNWNVRNCICWRHLKILNRRVILLAAITSDGVNETRRGMKGGINYAKREKTPIGRGLLLSQSRCVRYTPVHCPSCAMAQL